MARSFSRSAWSSTSERQGARHEVLPFRNKVPRAGPGAAVGHAGRRRGGHAQRHRRQRIGAAAQRRRRCLGTVQQRDGRAQLEQADPRAVPGQRRLGIPSGQQRRHQRAASPPRRRAHAQLHGEPTAAGAVGQQWRHLHLPPGGHRPGPGGRAGGLPPGHAVGRNPPHRDRADRERLRQHGGRLRQRPGPARHAAGAGRRIPLAQAGAPGAGDGQVRQHGLDRQARRPGLRRLLFAQSAVPALGSAQARDGADGERGQGLPAADRQAGRGVLRQQRQRGRQRHPGHDGGRAGRRRGADQQPQPVRRHLDRQRH